jgi:hypothetical protein
MGKDARNISAWEDLAITCKSCRKASGLIKFLRDQPEPSTNM